MEQTIVYVLQSALAAAVYVSAPPVLAALAVGLGVSVLQTATQIQEQTVAYVPKLVAVAAALVLAGPWMLSQLVRLTAAMFEQIAVCGGW